MLRKVFQTGNSTVVSLPKEILDFLSIKVGDQVSIELDKKQHRVVVSTILPKIAVKGIDRAFATQVDNFIDQYRDALNELAK